MVAVKGWDLQEYACDDILEETETTPMGGDASMGKKNEAMCGGTFFSAYAASAQAG
ncbi:MAG: hypothetical protein JOZ18_19070 [Chloroflexi bacterium]|nr:hypothetical protein [Chloroflexota bacterium]